MAILTKNRFLAQMRVDLEDLEVLLNSLTTDAKFFSKQFWSDKPLILKGFKVSGLNAPSPVTVDLTDATLINASNSGDFSWFVADEGATPLSVVLQPSSRNYLELELSTENNTPLTKAFWDPSALGGSGAEFNQIVDTVTDLKINVVVNTTSFTGSPDRLPLAIIDTDASNNAKLILDKRELFYRLGLPGSPENEYSWSQRTEPTLTLAYSVASGAFTVGETITFSGGETAVVVSDSGTELEITSLSADSIAVGNTVLGSQSGNDATVDSVSESFSGADKDIGDMKSMLDALMTEIKIIKGTNQWYADAQNSITGVKQFLDSIIVPATDGASYAWDGSILSLTDEGATPADADVIAKVRMLGSGLELGLTRQDGTGGSAQISIQDNELVYISISNSDQDFTGTDYQVTARQDFISNDNNYWIAYREGTKLIVRGLGELEAGESKEISDETTKSLRQFLGFDPETATSVPYTATPNAGLSGSFSTASSLVQAISANAQNINSVTDTLSANVYDEQLAVITGAPSSSNEISGPVTAGTIISLPNDSRDGGSSQSYIVGNGIIELYKNGQYLNLGSDWQEVGSIGNPSSDIQIDVSLDVDDILTFRIDTAGGYIISGGGGGAGSLQDAYNLGRQITTNSGQPVVISGPAGEKLLQINGDLEVTGVIDPQGLQLTREGSNPLAGGQDGIYVNTSGDLIQVRDGLSDVNLTQTAAGNVESPAVKVDGDNTSGATLSKLSPVRIDPTGDFRTINVSVESEALAIAGVVKSDIIDSGSGEIISNGKIEDITTSAVFGDVLYVSKSGSITNVKPSIGVDGFTSGDAIIRLGVVSKNRTNPSNKDLLVNISIIGIL